MWIKLFVFTTNMARGAREWRCFHCFQKNHPLFLPILWIFLMDFARKFVFLLRRQLDVNDFLFVLVVLSKCKVAGYCIYPVTCLCAAACACEQRDEDMEIDTNKWNIGFKISYVQNF